MACGSLTAVKAREPPNRRGLVVTFTQMKHGRYHYHSGQVGVAAKVAWPRVSHGTSNSTKCSLGAK